MKIDIVSDTICPWCFIGKRRLERALAMEPELEPEIAWHPFQLNPEMPPEGMGRALYLEMKFGGASRAHEVYRVVHEAAASEGLAFDLDAIARTPNTLASHRLIHYAGRHGRQEAVVEALFRAYFLNGADIGALPVMCEIAEATGLDADVVEAYLAGDADADVIRARDQQARALGINGVPCFIVDGRYAISGAQDPEVFQQVFAVARQDAKAPAPAPAE
jgi:predicted DsbA family dithiol-disulfide isomerase